MDRAYSHQSIFTSIHSPSRIRRLFSTPALGFPQVRHVRRSDKGGGTSAINLRNRTLQVRNRSDIVMHRNQESVVWTRRLHYGFSLMVMIGIGLGLATLHGQTPRQQDQLPPPFATPSARKFPKVIGWPANTTPHAPKGFTVDVLASGLESPRWL